MSALPQEQAGLLELLVEPQKVKRAGRTFWLGKLEGQPVVLGLSRIGKVSAAIAATVLIEHFGATQLLFTGVAGGLGDNVAVGDVVVAQEFIQHDLDVSPLFPRYEVPAYQRSRFACDSVMTQSLLCVTREVIGQSDGPCRANGFTDARVHAGLIASGDRFVCGADESTQLKAALMSAGHAALAVEMEGAAVAQVCADYGLPYAAMRTISDRADDEAHLDFGRFIETVAGPYAVRVILGFLKHQREREGTETT